MNIDSHGPWGSSSVCVCILAGGRDEYIQIADQSALSVLENSTFDIVFSNDRPDAPVQCRASHRVRPVHLPRLPTDSDRAAGFLRKFDGLAAALDFSPARWFVMLDADAIFVRPVEESDIAEALEGHSIGMAEQCTITGSTMTREDFLRHYSKHTMIWFGDESSPPPLERFHYFNSGVVMAERSELEKIVSWAQNIISASQDKHEVCGELIADQDYLQYWANTLHPGCCVTLPWFWNHCEHWDNGFPRQGARILHLSNFCHGPTPSSLHRMVELRKGILQAGVTHS